jgi:predicted DNA binding CopG/RHH family protein
MTIRPLVRRDRVLTIKISSRELDRVHRAAQAAGLSLSDFVRRGLDSYSRELRVERVKHDEEARS